MMRRKIIEVNKNKIVIEKELPFKKPIFRIPQDIIEKFSGKKVRITFEEAK